MKRFVFVLALLTIVSTTAVSQRFVIDTTYLKTGGSAGGAVLYAPSYTTDQFFTFPAAGGTLLTTANFGGWLVGGQALSATGLLGSTNTYDVSLISGGLSNIRLTLLNGTPAVLLPTRTELRLGDVAGGEYSAIKAPQIQTGNITYVLPYYKPTEARQRLQVDTLNGDTVVLGYTTEEKSTDVSFDLIGTATENSTMTPVIVQGMSISVLAGKTYAFEAIISLCNTNANPKATISFTIPTGATLHYCHMDLTSANGSTQCNLTEAPHDFETLTCPTEEHYLLKGFIRTNGTGGSVDMYIATTNAGDAVRITEASYMQITTN